MPVPDPEEVGDDAVTRATLHVGVHALSLDTVRPAFMRVILAEKVENTSFAAQNFCDRESVDELHHPVPGGGGEDPVGRQAEIEILPS